MHLDSPEALKTDTAAQAAVSTEMQKEPDNQPSEAAAEPAAEQEALHAELSALRVENRTLKEKLKAAAENTALSNKPEKEQAPDAVRQLTELKEELTDAVYLLVTAYEAATEKIDRLLAMPVPQTETQAKSRLVPQAAAGIAVGTAAGITAGTALSSQLPGDTDEKFKKLAEDLPDTMPQEKKISIIETLKNNARPAAHVKPTLAVTHKERANAKHLLQKYSKIK